MNLNITNNQKEKLSGVLHKANAKKSVVIVCHGHTGNKDRPFPTGICKALRKAGINSFRFDFSGNGESEGRFEDSTFSKEAQDLRSVVDHFCREGYDEIGIIGHSMGAVACVVEAANDKRLKFVIWVAGPVHLESSFKDLLASKQTRKIKNNGRTEIQFFKESSKKWLTVSKKFFADLKKVKPLAEVKKIKVPILFIHGTEDEAVPVKECEMIFAEANPPKELIVIHGANHCFDDKKHHRELEKEIAGWIKK